MQFPALLTLFPNAHSQCVVPSTLKCIRAPSSACSAARRKTTSLGDGVSAPGNGESRDSVKATRRIVPGVVGASHRRVGISVNGVMDEVPVRLMARNVTLQRNVPLALGSVRVGDESTEWSVVASPR